MAGTYDAKKKRNNDCFIGDEVDAFLANPNKLSLIFLVKNLQKLILYGNFYTRIEI